MIVVTMMASCLPPSRESISDHEFAHQNRFWQLADIGGEVFGGGSFPFDDMVFGSKDLALRKIDSSRRNG